MITQEFQSNSIQYTNVNPSIFNVLEKRRDDEFFRLNEYLYDVFCFCDEKYFFEP